MRFLLPLIAGSSLAMAEVITFDQPANFYNTDAIMPAQVGRDGTNYDGYKEQGFKFEIDTTWRYDFGGVGPAVLAWDDHPNNVPAHLTVTLSATNGILFNLLGFDTNGWQTVKVTGSNGATYFGPMIHAWTSHVIGGFTGLAWATFEVFDGGQPDRGTICLDNVVITHAPEPLTLTLAGAGAAAAWAARRRLA
jgi:hypothetical protein